jgi:hypothetical protein
MKDTTRTAHPARRRRWRVLLVLVGVLVLLRILLPYVVLHLANKRLAGMPGYFGHIADIDIALIRGAYVIDGFHLDKADSLTGKRSPFLAARMIDLSVEWKALFHGSIVGELVIEHPKIVFTLDSVEPTQVQKDTADFRDCSMTSCPCAWTAWKRTKANWSIATRSRGHRWM